MTRDELARALFRACHVTGRFRLRSGAESQDYSDEYRFESDPRLLAAVGAAPQPLVPPSTEILAGLELGGVSIAVVLAQQLGLPVVFVRKAAKEYGTRRLAEGVDIAGRRLLVVEDVVTSGGQVVRSALDVRERGAVVETAICVVDRGAGGREALSDAGIELRALFTLEELRAAR